ncbi:hypothetical protein IJ425_03625 [bacterium]|nr:hypothetical protein [bacterium]
MLDFLLSKAKVQAYGMIEVPIEMFEMLGVGQINPYCKVRYENEIFITVVNFANEARNYDEKEGLILTKFFSVRKCPKCRKTELIPVRMRINLDNVYRAHEEEVAYDAFEEHPSRRHFPSMVDAYCNSCSSCFEIKIKSKDAWVKEAKRIKEKNLLTGSWEEYCLD